MVLRHDETAGTGPDDFVVASVGFDDDSADRLSQKYAGSIPKAHIKNWPMVYILTNDEEAYVGQTTSIARRLAQHEANPEKAAFETVNAIYNPQFNASVVVDYEHRLIDLMQGDGRFELTNRNAGQSDVNYYSRELYAELFEQLWADLRDLELVGNSIAAIEQSEAFKFSPFKVLTPDQEFAVQEILAAITKCLEKPGSTAAPIVVQGVPGTGKTVLAISLLKTLKDLAASTEPAHAPFRDINVRLLEPVTGLRETLHRALAKTRNLSKADVIGPNDLAKEEFGHRSDGPGFDVVLVDEAHLLSLRKNLPPLQYRYYDNVTDTLGLAHGAPQIDWVLSQARVSVFFYDPLQAIGPKNVGAETMRDRLGDSLETPIVLRSQMRVRGGDDYLAYVRRLLFDQAAVPQTFSNYEFRLHASFTEFEDLFERTLEEHPLTRMVAGYSWKWVSNGKANSHLFDISIDGVEKRWNRTFRDWVGKGMRNRDIALEVGCIHSTQGYDLSHAFVIIGPDLTFDPSCDRIRIDGDRYFDRSGKRGATDADLDTYIKNIYYVLLTRGIEATHVYVCDRELRRHLARFIET